MRSQGVVITRRGAVKRRGGSIRQRQAMGTAEETVDTIQRGRSGLRRAARVPERFRHASMQRFDVERHQHRAWLLFCLVAQVRTIGSAPRLAALLRSIPLPGGSEVPGFKRAGHGSDRAWSLFCARAQLESAGDSKQAIALCVDRRLTRRRRVAPERPLVQPSVRISEPFVLVRRALTRGCVLLVALRAGPGSAGAHYGRGARACGRAALGRTC